MAIVWLVVALVFAVAEVGTAALVGGFFTLGALAAAVAAFLGADVLIQVIVFAAVSVVGLVIARRPLMAYLKTRHGPEVRSGVYQFIGQEAVVIDPIRGPHDRGHVRISGEEWLALSRDGLPVSAGSTVRVLEIKGATLLVERIQLTPGPNAEGTPPSPLPG